MKNKVTFELSEIFKMGDLTPLKVSKLLTEKLNADFPNGWICLIGKNFIANISHEPRTFIRMTYDGLCYLVYKSMG